MKESSYYYGTGRRKSAVARVRLYPGGDSVMVNGKALNDYLPVPSLQAQVLRPLQVVGAVGRFNVVTKVEGGGISGQAGAIAHGIARALLVADASLRAQLRSFGLLTRDPRVKERKKYGLKRARKAPQYTKR
ncbi:MAG: 30S ribosomal protein S9 [Chloroflexi bacterium]|nr:30S ribosomal protein S9 [Chloroflexota bacterium]